MHHQHARRRYVTSVALLSLVAPSGLHARTLDAPPIELTKDPVVARLYQHLGAGPKPVVLVVGAEHFSPGIWRRVKNLVAFRLHRPLEDGTTQADAAVYLVRTSAVYTKAAAVLRNGSTNYEYVWCLLAAVLSHEAAHTTPETEREALEAEASQLRRCLFASHLFTSSGWSAGAYLQKVEAKLRNPRQHY
jgi:hypothetical protein